MSLKPVLGPVQLTFYGVGVIVGAGVYSVIGAAAGQAGEGLWLSFLVGAAVALLTAFSYAEMASAFPTAGAEFVYIRKAWPRADWAAFGVGVAILLGGAATAATVAVSFGGYLKAFVAIPTPASAVALLALCTAVVVWGLRESSWVNMLFTSIEVGGLLLVLAAAAWGGEIDAPAPPPSVGGMMGGAAVLFFVYLGFEEIANLTEEVKDPGRTVPLAIFVSLGVTSALYVAIAIAVVGLLPPQDLASSEAPLAAAIQSVWPRAGAWLTAIALFATANTVLITLIATSRLVYSMAREKEIPSAFAALAPKRETPWAAALLVLAMAAALAPLGDVKVLAEMSSFAALLAFLSVNAALIALRYSLPDHERPFRTPLALGRLPLIPALAIAAIAVMLAFFDPQIYLAGLVAAALSGVALLARSVWSRRKPATGRTRPNAESPRRRKPKGKRAR